MTAPFPARRRAEEFDALVSGASSTTPRPPLTERDAERFADLLAVVDDLRAAPEVVPRPAFTAALRERLMLEADTVLVDQPARARAEEARLVLPTRPRARDRRLATLLGGAALIGATTSMAVAAQTALPGDSLYPVKRAIEDARTGLANDDADRGARLLAHAGGRLDEVDELSRTSSPLRSAAVADTLVTFDEQATEAAARPPRGVRRVRRRAGHPLAAQLHRRRPRPARRSRAASRTPPATSWSPPGGRSPRSTRGPRPRAPSAVAAPRPCRPSSSPPRPRASTSAAC